MFLWHAAHDGYLGNTPPGRLQVCWFLDQKCQQCWPKTSVREIRFSRHGNQTDSDERLGWFQHSGIAALMPKPSVVFGTGYLCPTLSLSLGVRLLCHRGMGRELYFSKCYCTSGEFTSIKLVVCKGLYNVRCDDLVGNDLGPRSGWQQNTQH